MELDLSYHGIIDLEHGESLDTLDTTVHMEFSTLFLINDVHKDLAFGTDRKYRRSGIGQLLLAISLSTLERTGVHEVVIGDIIKGKFGPSFYTFENTDNLINNVAILCKTNSFYAKYAGSAYETDRYHTTVPTRISAIQYHMLKDAFDIKE